MATYIDGFVLCVSKKNMSAYKKMAAAGKKIWMEHGALQYMECVGKDLQGMKGCNNFLKLAKPKKGETVVFSWVLYKSKAHHDAVNKKVMADKRMAAFANKAMPFDPKRMAYGQFETLV